MSLVVTAIPIHVASGSNDMGDIRSYIRDRLRQKDIVFHDSMPDHEETRTRYEIHSHIVTANASGVTCSRHDIDRVIDAIGNEAVCRGQTSVRGDFDISLDNTRVEVKIYL